MHAVCDINDLPVNSSRGFLVADQNLFVVHSDEGLFAYRNQCPHLGVELEWVEDQFLDAEGAYIQCATHGALFAIASGECVYGPCLGQFLQVLPCRLLEGQVLVDLSQADPG